MWAFQSFFGMFFDAMVGQAVHRLGAAQPVDRSPWNGGAERPVPPQPEPGGGLREAGGGPAARSIPPAPPAPAAWEAAPSGAAAEAALQADDLRGDDLKLVEYTIVSIRPCRERVLPEGSGEIMVRGSTTREGLTAQIIADYPRRHEIPPEDKRYLRVHYRVLSRWPHKRPGQGRKINVLKGLRDAIRDLPPWREDQPPEPPAPSSLTWDGSGTPSQVGARGRVTLTKAWNGSGYDVTMEGRLSVHSRTYGYVRHGLPPGFLPVRTDPQAYPCEVQQHATQGDLSGVDNYGGRGVHIRCDDFPGYQGRATLWFPEKSYNGEITLRCTWQTNEATDPTAWESHPGIEVVQ